MKQYRKYQKINCKTCNKELNVRIDYIKNHTGFCQSCRKKEDWKNLEYAKQCSDSHKGKKLSKEHKEKISIANIGRIKSEEECKNISNSLKKEYGLASARHLYNRYKSCAKKRKHIFELTLEEFMNITSQNCRYCGAIPKMVSKPHNRVNGEYIHNGIDRKDNNTGYTIENSVSCCTHCNFAKHTMSEDEFKEWGKALYNHFINRN